MADRPALLRGGIALARKAGDALECECPVCRIALRGLENIRRAESIGETVCAPVVENMEGRPQHRMGMDAGPNLEGALLFGPREEIGDSGHGTAENKKQKVPKAERGHVYVIGSEVWVIDGREA